MKSIEQKIKDKGIMKTQVAKMVGIAPSTLSRIISGDQSYISVVTEERINWFLDRLNSDDENIFNRDEK